jgi:hypothetical protein
MISRSVKSYLADESFVKSLHVKKFNTFVLACEWFSRMLSIAYNNFIIVGY